MAVKQIIDFTAMTAKPDRTSDYFLVYDGSGDVYNKVTPAVMQLGLPIITALTGTAATVDTTASDTQLFSYTLPAGTLGSDNVWHDIFIPFQHTTDQNVTLRWRVYINAVEVFNLVSGTLSSGTRNGEFTVTLRRNGDVDNVIANGRQNHNGAFVHTSVTTSGGAFDLSTEQTVSVNVQHSASAAAVGVTGYGLKALTYQYS